MLDAAPRYIWDRGETWAALTGRRRYYSNAGYNYSYGVKLYNRYDFSNDKYGLGVGTELPFGFIIYIEPSATFVNYDAPRLVVKDLPSQELVKKDILFAGNISLSSNKIEVFGFVPVLVYRYLDRKSNIWQHEYSKHSVSFQIQRNF